MFDSKYNNIFIGLTVSALCLVLILLYMNVKNAPDLSLEPGNVSVVEKKTVKPAPSQKAQQPPPTAYPSTEQKPASVDNASTRPEFNKEYPLDGGDPAEINPAVLKQAQTELDQNRRYEAEARATLPTLSVQTHNPVWALEYEVSRQMEALGGIGGAAVTEAEPKQGPLPAPVSGEFGMIQPPAGEIWLRIPAGYAAEHRDIMAQNADLYRAETGYSGPVTITLWVGGRPYTRQQYE